VLDDSNLPQGATPLGDYSGLKQSWVQTRDDLAVAEGANIGSAIDWLTTARVDDWFTVTFYQQLHRRMLGDVWTWAGTYRTTQTNIGVQPQHIPRELGHVAMHAHQDWHAGWPLIASVAVYHHALVQVHPWPDGNGRFARLATDVVVQRLSGMPALAWTTGSLTTNGTERDEYITALKAADGGNHGPLTEYLRRLNPDH
jgi:Fic-DOC domain mobile mystery protein B